MNKLSDELANAWVSKTHIDLNNFGSKKKASVTVVKNDSDDEN